MQVQVTLAAVPMRATTPQLADTIGTAGTYLTISNASGAADELVAVCSPSQGKSHWKGATDSAAGTPPSVILSSPPPGTLTLNPAADDAMLQDPAPFENSRYVR